MQRESAQQTARNRLGFAVRILGDPRLQLPNARRPELAPHLSVALIQLRDVLLYLLRQRIFVYRISPALALPAPGQSPQEARRLLDECAAELDDIGALCLAAGIRLTLHLRSGAGLTTPDPAAASRAREAIEAQAQLFSALGLGDSAVLVAHLGGRHDNRRSSLERAAAAFERLSAPARAMLAIEHDRAFSLNDLLHVHALCGVPVVFDHLHHLIYNPERLGEREALAYALATWPSGRRPKVHFSSPRTELRVVTRPATTGKRRALEPPRVDEHSDYLHPFEFARFLRQAIDLRACDIMLEAKAGDLALLRLREDIARFCPELSGALG